MYFSLTLLLLEDPRKYFCHDRGIQEVQNCSPSWLSGEVKLFCIHTFYSWVVCGGIAHLCVSEGRIRLCIPCLSSFERSKKRLVVQLRLSLQYDENKLILSCLSIDFLQVFEPFIAASSENCNTSKECSSYFILRNIDIFGESVTFNIINHLEKLRVETEFLFFIQPDWCFYTHALHILA